jgi:bifunctional non-homologous end joining protein LigD
LLANAARSLHYCDLQNGHGRAFYDRARKLGLEGIVCKRTDSPYAPTNRGLWRKVKCLHRQEFVVVGWTDLQGSRPYLGALPLAHYDSDGKLIYVGGVGTGIDTAELERVWRRPQPLDTARMPLGLPPQRSTLGSARPRFSAACIGCGGQVSRLDREQSASPGGL